jgi:hypothetical protein
MRKESIRIILYFIFFLATIYHIPVWLRSRGGFIYRDEVVV